MNKELLLKVADAIEANPEHFDMNAWAEETPSCGTTACIVGWALVAFNGAGIDAAPRLWDAAPDYEISEIIGITFGSEKFGNLAYVSTWRRRDLAARYIRAARPKTKARIAAEYVRWFVATDGGANQ